MKKDFIFFAALLFFCCASCKKEKLAIAGSDWQEIAIVDKASGRMEWRHGLEKEEECNDIEVTPEGHVLYAYAKGARLITRDRAVIWDYKATEAEEIHSATRLKDGGYLLGVCGEPARIVELDEKGQLRKEIPFHTVTPDRHRQFRQVTKTAEGTYLIPLMEKRKILQISPQGRNQGSIFVGSELFSVKVSANGTLLVSCGKDGRWVEVDPAVPRIDSLRVTNHLKGATMLFTGEIFCYENGNKLVANSARYSEDKSQSLLLEVNPDDEVVWTLPFNREIRDITSVYSFYE